MSNDVATTERDLMTATTVRVESEHGRVTVFGRAVLLLDGPPDEDGRIQVRLRYESRSLFAWFTKYPTDVFAVDVWSPVPQVEQDTTGSLPWMRVTSYRTRWASNHFDRRVRSFLATGWAERDVRSGEVLRYRQDVTAPDGEESPAAEGATP